MLPLAALAGKEEKPKTNVNTDKKAPAKTSPPSDLTEDQLKEIDELTKDKDPKFKEMVKDAMSKQNDDEKKAADSGKIDDATAKKMMAEAELAGVHGRAQPLPGHQQPGMHDLAQQQWHQYQQAHPGAQPKQFIHDLEGKVAQMVNPMNGQPIHHQVNPFNGQPMHHQQPMHGHHPVPHHGQPVFHGQQPMHHGQPIPHHGQPISHHGQPIMHHGQPPMHHGQPPMMHHGGQPMMHHEKPIGPSPPGGRHE